MKNFTSSFASRALSLFVCFIAATTTAFSQTGHAYSFTDRGSGTYICQMDEMDDVGYGVCVKLWHYYNEDSWYTFLDLTSKQTEDNIQTQLSKILYRKSKDGKASTNIILLLDDQSIIKLDGHSVRVNSSDKSIEFNLVLDVESSNFKRLMANNIIGLKVLGEVVPLKNFKSAITLKRMHDRILEAQGGSTGSGSGNLLYNSSAGFKYGGTTRYITPATSSSLGKMRENLTNNDACKVGALNSNGAGVIIRGGNGYFTTSSTPEKLTTKLKTINNDRKTIVDVNITEAGLYVVLFGKNGYSVSNSAPAKFLEALKKYNEDKEELWSACFTDGGRWAVITDKHMWGDADTNAFLKEADEKCGEVLTVFLTDRSRVACCKNGVYYENLPSNVVTKLGELNFKPKFIKFTDDGLFLITGEDGSKNTWYL